VTSCEFTLGQDKENPQRGAKAPTFLGFKTGLGRVAFRNIQIRTER
jgi:hypothetical protein